LAAPALISSRMLATALRLAGCDMAAAAAAEGRTAAPQQSALRCCHNSRCRHTCGHQAACRIRPGCKTAAHWLLPLPPAPAPKAYLLCVLFRSAAAGRLRHCSRCGWCAHAKGGAGAVNWTPHRHDATSLQPHSSVLVSVRRAIALQVGALLWDEGCVD
jgi:hypothetical protein